MRKFLQKTGDAIRQFVDFFTLLLKNHAHQF